jgi:hypothetical protein
MTMKVRITSCSAFAETEPFPAFVYVLMDVFRGREDDIATEINDKGGLAQKILFVQKLAILHKNN